MLPSETLVTGQTQRQQRYLVPFVLVTSLFFLWGVANAMNGTLIKHFQTALNLTPGQAGFVDSAFYIGYFLMALPAAFLMNSIGYKKGILIGLLLYAVGALLFYPAAEVRDYGFFLFALFTIACGLAFLETAANPYVTVLGDPATSETRINFAQSFNGLGIIISPVVGSLFIFSDTEYTNTELDSLAPEVAERIRVEEALSLQTPYLFIAGVVLFVALLFLITKMPAISTDDERSASMKGITRHRHLIWGVIAQFFYVGAQASIWGYFINLKLHYAPAEHLGIVETIYRFGAGMTPTQIAGFHLSFAFILFMVGRFVGTWLLTKFAANKLLLVYALACVALLSYAALTTGIAAIVAISFTNFFMSIMFPTIFALSIKNLGAQVKIGSGLVIMAIAGGAVLPPIMGRIFLEGSPGLSLMVPLIGFAVIVFFAWKGYKTKPV
jgi:FHS family L-fucose permease-like MFS transporter